LTFGKDVTPSSKLWVARIASIPVLLFLPLFGFVIGFGAANEHLGDSMPWFGLLGFFFGGMIAVVLSFITTFAPKNSPSAKCFRIIVTVAVLEVGTLVVLRIVQ
jgi:hypothetical protein